MSEQKLTPVQIAQLFAFCKKHYVQHYDLQIELVDHLASSIEQKWVEDPTITFSEALPSAYKQFGISGFSKFREMKEKALRKKYNRLLWKYIGEFYRLPKIILTIAISFLLFAIIRYSDNLTHLSLIILGTYFISLLVYLVIFYKKKSQLELNTSKSFLQIDYLNSFRGSLYSVGFIPFNLLSIYNIIAREFQFSPIGIYLLELLASFLITLFIFVMIAIISYLPRRIKEDFIRDFPQFVKS